VNEKLTCNNPNCEYFGKADQLIRYGKDRHRLQRWHCKSCLQTLTEPLPSPSLKKHHRKEAQKGLKSLKGQGELYDETKAKWGLSLTPTAVRGLDELAEEFNVSRSELVERIGRKIIMIYKV